MAATRKSRSRIGSQARVKGREHAMGTLAAGPARQTGGSENRSDSEPLNKPLSSQQQEDDRHDQHEAQAHREPFTNRDAADGRAGVPDRSSKSPLPLRAVLRVDRRPQIWTVQRVYTRNAVGVGNIARSENFTPDVEPLRSRRIVRITPSSLRRVDRLRQQIREPGGDHRSGFHQPGLPTVAASWVGSCC